MPNDTVARAIVSEPNGEQRYGMQVLHAGKWKWVAASTSEKPYAFPGPHGAAAMLDACYPDQCREERLAGRHEPYLDGEKVRVAPLDVDGQPINLPGSRFDR